jgi:GT2 family glycosyltransferase
VTATTTTTADVGAVVIGRNEGARLGRALEAARAAGVPVVYVDSGSTDGSVAAARAAGVDVVELDAGRPFTAGRARNAGFARLTQMQPSVRYVQFVDGDCELNTQWMATAREFLDTRPDVAIVAGQLAERHADASVYNALCAMEWRRPAGEVGACGGIFMARVEAFAAVGGFAEDVPAAEDDELCLRLRARGGKVWSLAEPMATHDAAMTRFSQWWRRARRAGFAYAQGAAMHGGGAERHFVRDCRRIWFWGLVLPILAIVPAYWTRGWSLLLLAGYLVLAARMYSASRGRGWTAREARVYAFFTVLAKWPGLIGLIEFHWRRRRGAGVRLIEYKEAPKTA